MVHLKLVIPLSGQVAGGNQAAYTYLPNIT